MPSYPEIQTAVPPDGGGQVGKTLLRNAVTNRTAYVLGDAESLGDLYCVDPVTGAAILVVVFKGRLFWFDSTDSLTSDDGITCLVSGEGRRYKLSDSADVFAYSVLSKSLSAPPVSPSTGAAYLVAAAATGPWVGKSNFVAVLTERGPGWEFIDFGVGRLVYVEDEDAYYHRNAGGTWVAGFGNLVIGTNAVRLSAAINFGKRVIVENMTTTAPPGSASVGTAYVIGPSATGAWSGHDRKIAICEATNQFTIYAPGNGWTAYDKSQGNTFTFNGTAWVSSGGVIVNAARVKTAAIVTPSQTGSAFYAYSTSSPPKTTHYRTVDPATISYASKKASAELEISFRASVNWLFGVDASIGQDDPAVLAIYRDSETDAIAWMPVGNHNSFGPYVNVTLSVTTPDALSHTYTIAATYGKQLATKNTVVIQSFALRDLSIKELS